MTENTAALSLGAEIRAGITVRGHSGAQAISLAKPRLDEWQGQQIARLPDRCHFDSSDGVSEPRNGHHTVTRTLKVVADEDAQ